MTAQESDRTKKQPRHGRSGKIARALTGIGLFVAGAVASPALEDSYEWVRGLISGRTVSGTQIRQINVVGRDGTLASDYKVEKIVKGTCAPGSIDEFNPNGYRCVFKDEGGTSFVVDPCFAINEGAAVACVTAPWDRTVLKIDLDTPVEFNSTYIASDQDEKPWALELKDPRHPRETWRCMTLTGSTTPIAGNQPNWWCQEGENGGARALNDLIVGEGNVWKVLFYHPEESELVEADVVTAWY